MLDQVYIREELARKRLVAFVGNDSILPRQSGVSDRPLKDAILFTSPENFAITLDLPVDKLLQGWEFQKV